MITHVRFIAVALSAMFALCLAGCGENSSKKTGGKTGPETGGPPATVDAGHEHASEGPHGGSLIELGNEEYHAELVHDEAAGSVTVYVLDSAAKVAVPIDATEVIINLKHEGKGEQFKLAASADRGDPAGKSSRFVSLDAELAADLDREGAEAQLVITVSGKQFRGALEHGHEGGEKHAH